MLVIFTKGIKTGSTNIPLVKGDNPVAYVAAEIINNIIYTINNSGNRKPDAVLYLGNKQQWAVARIDIGDSLYMTDNKSFAGWPVIWVKEESYCRLAS